MRYNWRSRTWWRWLWRKCGGVVQLGEAGLGGGGCGDVVQLGGAGLDGGVVTLCNFEKQDLVEVSVVQLGGAGLGKGGCGGGGGLGRGV